MLGVTCAKIRERFLTRDIHTEVHYDLRGRCTPRSEGMSATEKESLKHRLHAAMTAQFRRSGAAWRHVLYASIGVIAISATTAFVEVGHQAPWLDYLSLLLGSTVFFLRANAQGLFAKAEKLRRAHFMLNSLAIRPRDGVVMNLPASADCLDLGAVSADRRYFDATTPPGPHRMVENLTECASYSEHLARRFWRLCCAVSIAGIALVLGMLWVDAAEGVGLTRVVPHAFALFVVGFIAELGVLFFRLEQASVATLSKTETLNAHKDLQVEDVLAALGDYDTALASTGIPIPDRIYKSMESELNKRWALLKKSCPNTGRNERGSAPLTKGDEDSPKPRNRLLRLLLDVFDNVEIRIFACHLDEPSLEDRLPGSSASPLEVANALVEWLTRRPWALAGFFAKLEEARPRYAEVIRELDQAWGRESSPVAVC